MENITDADLTRLENAVIQGEEYAEKLALFKSAFIPPENRRFILSAFAVYDACSKRQRDVFTLRLKMYTFCEIGEALGIGTSTAKKHWYRALKKVSSVLV
tara:strand:+ start:236 stop:535 length:300 start_codon:yes stop_codon:yes gene_type:complete